MLDNQVQHLPKKYNILFYETIDCIKDCSKVNTGQEILQKGYELCLEDFRKKYNLHFEKFKKQIQGVYDTVNSENLSK